MNDDNKFIAFYGTLMQDQHTAIRNYLEGKLVPHGRCLIPGKIYDMGRYPALKVSHDSSDAVHGELYVINDDEPLKLLDEYEAHDNYDNQLPGFTRRLVGLISPLQLAWVYEYDGPVSSDKLIDSDRWLDKARPSWR